MDKLLDKEFFRNLKPENMSNELQDTITALRKKVTEQERDIKELLKLVRLVNDSFGGGNVMTFSERDILDFNNAIKKHS